MSISLSLLVSLVVASCGADDPIPLGGAELLPGPLPTGVVVAPEQLDAVPAPEFSLTLLDGTQIDPADYWLDRPVVLVFFSSWCTVCARQQADLNALVERYGDTIAVVGVAAVDTIDPLRAYLSEHSVPYAVGLDDSEGRVWNAYAVREPPVIAVVGPGGRLIRGWPGGTDAETLQGVLDALVTLPRD